LTAFAAYRQAVGRTEMKFTAAFKTILFLAGILPGCAHPSLVDTPIAKPHAQKSTSKGEVIAPASGAVFVGCGFLYVGNAGQVPFSALLKGDQAAQVKGSENVLVLDGVLVEIRMTTAGEIGVPTARGVKLLEEHRQWEAAYTAKVNGWPSISVGGGPVEVDGAGFDVMVWGYDLPREKEAFGQRIDRITYVTAAIADTVFVVALPLRPGDDPRPPARKAREIMRSLKRLEKPLDVHELADQVKSAKGVWSDCRAAR
jgi:hypothetical protein